MTTFNHLPLELQDSIYLMKHQLEMKDVMTQLVKRIIQDRYSYLPYSCIWKNLKLWYPDGNPINFIERIERNIKIGLYETDIVYENVYREFQPEQFK